MAANMYRVGDYVYFETSSTAPYQIRRIEELCKTASGTVEAKVTCFYRRRDLSSALIALADKHHSLFEESLEGCDGVLAEKTLSTLDEKRRHELKCHEVFLSRQVETLPATHIRGKCSVTLLSEAESPLSYLEHDDLFFYSLVYDNQQKSLIADHGEIRVGLRYQVEVIPDKLESPEQDTRRLEDLEELVWDCNKAPPDEQINQFMIIARAVGTFSRALDSTSAVRQPSLHMSAAAASRDITLLHAMDALHHHDYNAVSAISTLVSGGGPVLCRDEMEEWSASEANIFEEALDKYGKGFREIGLDFLPWKSVASIVEYYYMWKTTDRYVQQKRIKAAEAERKLKQVYIPPYNKANPAQIGDRQNGLDGRPCESCFTVRASQWFLWGPQHLQCRLCACCWTYWKKYGGLKRPASRVNSSQERGTTSGVGGGVTADGIVDGHLQPSIVKMQRCTLNGCGKEFRAKSQLVRHLADAHSILLQSLGGGGTDSPSSLLAVSGVGNAAVKTRAAFCLVTTPLTRLSRQLCKHVLSVRRSARQPFLTINVAAVKQECQQRLPDLLKLVRRLCTKKRVSMLQVSARLGISVDVDKPAILARTTSKPAPIRYAFPASTQNSVNSAANNPTRKRAYEHANGTESLPTVKRLNTDATRPQMSIKTTEPKMRGSAVSLQNGGVSSSGRLAGGPRVKKHTSVSVDTLDDVCFKSDTAFRKRRKQQITTLAIRRGARKPWQPVIKTSNSVDSSVILLD